VFIDSNGLEALIHHELMVLDRFVCPLYCLAVLLAQMRPGSPDPLQRPGWKSWAIKFISLHIVLLCLLAQMGAGSPNPLQRPGWKS